MSMKKKYCMDCIYTSRTAHCYKRHDACFKFNANDCPFYEENDYTNIQNENVKDENVGQPRFNLSRLLGWLKRLKWHKINNT